MGDRAAQGPPGCALRMGVGARKGERALSCRASQRQPERSGLVPCPASLHSRYFLREESVARRWEGTASKLGAEPSPPPALPAPLTSRPSPPAAETDPPGAQGTPGGASQGVGVTHPTDEPWAPSHCRSGHYHWGCHGKHSREGLCLAGTWGRCA